MIISVINEGWEEKLYHSNMDYFIGYFSFGGLGRVVVLL